LKRASAATLAVGETLGTSRASARARHGVLLRGTSNNDRFGRVMGHRVGSCFNLIPFHGFHLRLLLRLKLQRDFTFMPRRAVPASPGGECCRPGSASRSWRAPAPCQSCAPGALCCAPNTCSIRARIRCPSPFCQSAFVITPPSSPTSQKVGHRLACALWPARMGLVANDGPRLWP
jgi:hypothetical protein